MNSFKDDYIKYRLEKAEDAYNDALLLFENKSYNSCINRLYYSCYYSVSAICLKMDIKAKTHSGLKARFNEKFVKTGLIDLEMGKMYSDLMDWRFKGDYSDMFDFDLDTTQEVLPLVRIFITQIAGLIKNEDNQ